MGFFNDKPPIGELIEAIGKAGHRGVHNFTLGTLTTYFRLESARVSFADGILILDGLPGSARRKVFVYGGADPAELADLQRTAVLYSLDKLALAKQSKFKEMAYSLPDVFNPASYPNARKRSRRLSQPFTRLNTKGITVRPLIAADLPAIRKLHDEWCAWKLANPATIRMMFPKQRYYNCMAIAIARPDQYLAYGAFTWTGELLAARSLYLEGKQAFDLANFSAAWMTYADFAEDFYLVTMDHMVRDGADYLNCGATLDKRLHAFKAHWPHFTVESYAYGKISS